MLKDLLTNEEHAVGLSLQVDDHYVYVLKDGQQLAMFLKSMSKKSLRALIDLVIQTQRINVKNEGKAKQS